MHFPRCLGSFIQSLNKKRRKFLDKAGERPLGVPRSHHHACGRMLTARKTQEVQDTGGERRVRAA